MSHHDNLTSSDDLHERYLNDLNHLRQAVSNPENIVYAENNGILPIEMVEQARLWDPVFQDVVDTYGWPNSTDDGIIEPANRYGSAREFLSTIPHVDEYGPRRLPSMYFFNMLSVKPIKQYSEAVNGVDVNGVNPMLHRAHALAPDLFEPLRATLVHLYSEYGGVYDGDDKIMEQLLKPDNKQVVDAIYMAYRIMGTLLKVDDNDRRIAVTKSQSVSDRSGPLIICADEALRIAD